MSSFWAIAIVFVGIALVGCFISSICANQRYNRNHGTNYSYWQCMWTRAYCHGYDPDPVVVQQAVPTGTYQYNAGHTVVVASPTYVQQPQTYVASPMMGPPPMNPTYGYGRTQPTYGYSQPTQVFVNPQPTYVNNQPIVYAPHQPQPAYYQ
eukprot:GILI01009736.1.p1 GENE.GILI01009736.1~~GILI01009736.1.p1  ORF type:complete len:151 (+),score=9.10 GILI01009736.1:64-516(+)